MKFLDRLFKKKPEIQTVPIDEYNKTKQALQDANNRILTLTKANEDIIKDNDITLAETERLESDFRVLKIKSILDATTLTDVEKEKQLQVLPGSGLPIEFIEETYRPITKKNYVISRIGTKLPQKSVIEKRNDSNFIR